MARFFAWLLFFSIYSVALSGVSAEFRVWTGRNGKEIEAALVRQPGGAVVLETRKEKRFTIKRALLSDADQRYLASLEEVEGAATPDVPDGESAPPKTRALDLDALGARLEADTDLTGKGELARLAVIEALKSGRGEDGIDILSRFVVREFKARSGVLWKKKIEILSGAADGAVCLALLPEQKIRPDITEWLFASRSRLGILAQTLCEEDDRGEVIRIIETLYDHDSGNRDTFFNLIVAMAVVWDQPRPRIHGQMGSTGIPYEAEITSRYDHFRDVYSTSRGRPLYTRLGVLPLCFAVDTPVPISELVWARKHVQGSLSGWKKHFSEIEYDKARIESGVYSWPHGPYTLASIRKHGGICVDQAYYAMMTARAHGLPAIYFRGAGRRGGHAWFAYLKGKTEWELDVGRYAYDRYATGHAVNPQTNKRMTDHDVAYTCDHALRLRQYNTAHSYVGIASILLAHGEYDHARACAQTSRGLAKRYELPWDVEADVSVQQGKPEMAVKLLEEKARFFSRYPDIATRTRQRQAGLLREMGREAEAARILERQLKRVDDERGDLAIDLVFKQVKEYIERGDTAGARRKLEDLLKDQKDEGQKLLPIIDRYLDITARTGQANEAARFLKRFIGNCVRQAKAAKDKRNFLKFLLRAYENDGDEPRAARIRRDLGRI